MTYILITSLTITVSMFIIYKIANAVLGLKLQMKPLLLCAACAVIINIALPVIFARYSELTLTLYILLILSVFFAYFVAWYNDFKLVPKTTGQPDTPEMAAIYPEDLSVNVEREDTGFVKQRLCEDTAMMTAVPDNNRLYVRLQPKAQETGIEPPTPVSINTEPAELQSNSLDELLDYADRQKEAGQMDHAVKSLKKALALYSADDYAPFIVIEICNILKAQGAYDEAIGIYMQGHTLPAVRKDQPLQQEFVHTIAYLRIVKNILLSRGLGLIPFEEIPSDTRSEIETEFTEWRITTK